MDVVDTVLLAGGILTIVGVLATKISSRLGVPGLVLFLLLGMLAGSEGVGGIEFTDHGFAHAIGMISLAIILFDGGLRTSFTAIRRAWQPALVLATVGVLLTAIIVGFTSAFLLGLPLMAGLLLGSIVSSTDAAAVFLILRKQGIRLEERLSATLEVESGSNDPMAVFLTVAAAQVLMGDLAPGVELLAFFASQMGIGALAGIAVGHLGGRFINRISLEAPGLYPVLAGAIGAVAFGSAATLGGSGFLAIYLAGILIGNQPVVYRGGILHFHDASAWVAQILMFVLLGLLSFPSSLITVAGPGMVVAVVLVFLSRPLMIVLTMIPFGFPPRELTLLSWVGLKGAVPIILAIYPLTLGVPEGQLLFDLVFFVVLVSALVQGWSLPSLARRLGLQRPAEREPPVLLELSSLQHVDAEILAFQIGGGARACGERLADLPLPDGAVVAVIARGKQVIPPTGAFRLESGDHVFVASQHDVRPAVERIFGALFDDQDASSLPAFLEIAFRGDVTTEQLRDFFNLDLSGHPSTTLGDLLVDELGPEAMPGDFIERDGLILVIRSREGPRITRAGVRRTLPPSADTRDTQAGDGKPDRMRLR